MRRGSLLLSPFLEFEELGIILILYFHSLFTLEKLGGFGKRGPLGNLNPFKLGLGSPLF